jgi:Golgi phosphoprotein 3 (GPP34)
VDLAGGVAVRVASLCLDPSGRIVDRLLFSDAVRGGLMVDLALVGRLEMTADSIDVDPTPTGFAPADRVLAAMVTEPERSLDGWLDERRIGMREVVAANVASGRWTAWRHPLWFSRRYVDNHPRQTAADLARRPDERVAEWPPADACVTALAGAAGLLDRDVVRTDPPSAALLGAAGAADWVCSAVAEHLVAAAQRYRDQAGALGSGGFPI